MSNIFDFITNKEPETVGKIRTLDVKYKKAEIGDFVGRGDEMFICVGDGQFRRYNVETKEIDMTEIYSNINK